MRNGIKNKLLRRYAESPVFTEFAGKCGMGQKLDEYGRSDLHYAACDGDIDAAKKLVRQRDVNLSDKRGWTPLHFAAQSGSVEIAKLLLESGAIVDAVDVHGNTPLSCATFNSRGEGKMIALLRQAGADPLLKNAHGVSPVSLARNIGNYDVAQFFSDIPETNE